MAASFACSLRWRLFIEGVKRSKQLVSFLPPPPPLAVAEETEDDYSARRVRELVHRTQETAANNVNSIKFNTIYAHLFYILDPQYVVVIIITHDSLDKKRLQASHRAIASKRKKRKIGQQAGGRHNDGK